MSSADLFDHQLTPDEAAAVGNFLIGYLTGAMRDGDPVDPVEALDIAAGFVEDIRARKAGAP